jgi:O-antigen ligase
MNHAHNDVIEIAATGGVVGVVILLVATAVSLAAGWRWFVRSTPATREVCFGRLGFTIMTFCFLASLVDYPLRVPSLSVFFVIATLWCTGSKRQAPVREAVN